MLASLESLNFILAPGAGDWVDLFCLALLVIHISVGFLLGFARMLASFTAMLLALQGGYWLYPSLSHYLGHLVLFKNHAALTALFHYLFAVIIGLTVFFLLRLLLHRFFRLLVEQPIDRIFGALTGAALGLMVLFFCFSLFSLLPADSKARQTVCGQSRTGRIFTPCVRTILNIRPETVIRFTTARKSRQKQKSPTKARKPRRPSRNSALQSVVNRTRNKS
jgi:uncharacterized membrane protein required for colicin V production